MIVSGWIFLVWIWCVPHQNYTKMFPWHTSSINHHKEGWHGVLSWLINTQNSIVIILSIICTMTWMMMKSRIMYNAGCFSRLTCWHWDGAFPLCLGEAAGSRSRLAPQGPAAPWRHGRVESPPATPWPPCWTTTKRNSGSWRQVIQKVIHFTAYGTMSLCLEGNHVFLLFYYCINANAKSAR